MKTGVILPSFRATPDEAFAVAHEAELAGVDGVFCYDHLWPMGQPERPAIAPFPLLAAIAARTERICIGTLVARVGLVADAVLVSQFATLADLAPGRVVAALGTGDRLSAAENLAYGIAFEEAEVRQARLSHCAAAVKALGIPVWVGAGSKETNQVAVDLDIVLNLWDKPAERVRARAALSAVTWAGPGRSEGIAELVHELAEAGAGWVVLGWPTPLRQLVEAARSVSDER